MEPFSGQPKRKLALVVAADRGRMLAALWARAGGFAQRRHFKMHVRLRWFTGRAAGNQIGPTLG